MLYNQPFDQPSSPNAPYIDGNPAAGIEGSIVPAASVEFDQREIVEVINTAFIRHYTDFSGANCLTPSNGDLTQLRKAIEGFIRTTPTPSWYIDTNVTYTVHGAGATYPDLLTCLEDLSKFIITHNGFVTIAIAAGRWNYGASNIILDHANADRILITGAAMNSIPVAGDYPVSGCDAGSRAANAATVLANMRTHYTTELDFTSGRINSSCVGINVQNLLLVSDGSGPAWSGAICCTAGALFVNQCHIHGFACGGFVSAGGDIYIGATGTMSATYCGGGIGATNGNLWHSGALLVMTSHSGNGASCGFSANITGNSPIYANGNGTGGAGSTFGAMQFSGGSQFNTNGTNGGIFIDQGSLEIGSGCEIYGNNGYGIYLTVGSIGQAPNCSFSGNSGGSITAGNNSNCYAAGSSGVAGSCSPPANTIGNVNSYITV